MKYINFISIFLLIFISGSPVFYPFEDQIILGLFIINIILFLLKKNKFDKYFLIFFSIFALLTFIQGLYILIFPVITYAGLLLKIITAYLIVKNNSKSFIYNYINIIYYLTLISFAFYFIMIFAPNLQSVFTQYSLISSPRGNSNIIFYNFSPDYFPRNSGPFWEPGAFGGFLFFALFFIYLIERNFNNKKSIVLIVGILTTFSTSSYLALIILLLYYLSFTKSVYKLVLIPMLFIGFIFSFYNFNFLGEKIFSQLEQINSANSYLEHRNRFTSFILDVEVFLENPFLGTGKYDETRITNVVLAQNRNNGTSDFLASFGIIGFLLYFSFYLKSLKAIDEIKYYGIRSEIIILIIFLILGFSENYFTRIFFWSICFIYTIDSETLLSLEPKLGLNEK